MIQAPTTLCARKTKKSEDTGYCGNTLDCIIGFTRRGVPFCKNNRSEGTLVPSWRHRDLFPMEAISLILWNEVQSKVHFTVTKTF